MTSMDADREPIFLASDGWGDWYERNDRIDYAPGEIWQTHVPWDKTRRYDMPTYEDFGAMTLYRGTSIKVSPSEFESLWDGVMGGMSSRISTMGTEILSRHLSGGLGKSWSTDINVAYDFSSVTNDNDHLVGVVMQADWEGGSHDKQRNLSDWNFMVHQESEIQLDYGTRVSVTHIGFRMDGMSNSDVVMVPVSPRQFTTSVQGSMDRDRMRSSRGSRVAGTEFAPGPVYRGINTDMLTQDELEEIEAWADSNSFSLTNYRLAEPNYDLIYRIVDRFERSGLGRHWSKDYDVSRDFAEQQGDNIALIFIGDWDGQGIDEREFHRGWDGVSRPSNVKHEKEVTLLPGTNVTLVGLDVIMPNGLTSNIPVPTIQVTSQRKRKEATDMLTHEKTASPQTLYRGIPLSPDKATSDRIQRSFEAGDFYTVGEEILRIVDRDTGAGTSWTTRDGVAVRFALSNDSWIPYGSFAVVLEGHWAGGNIDHSRDRDDDDPDRYEEFEDEVRLFAGDKVTVTKISVRAGTRAQDAESYMESLKWTTWDVHRTLTALNEKSVEKRKTTSQRYAESLARYRR